MKQETKIDTPKNLETRITAALTSTDITSTDLEILLQETENTLSDTVVKIERERAFDLTKSPDAVAAHRAMTEAEVVRARLRLVLPELQQKLQEAEAREFAAQWEADYLHGDAVCNRAAESFACLPALFAKITDIYREREAVNAMRSKINSTAPPGEHRRLKDPELLRGDSITSLGQTRRCRRVHNSRIGRIPKRCCGRYASRFSCMLPRPRTSITAVSGDVRRTGSVV